MIHRASWKADFNSLTTVNYSGNRNISGYTGAMGFEANLNVQMMRLNQDYGFIQ
jgi:hypothetical protein